MKKFFFLSFLLVFIFITSQLFATDNSYNISLHSKRCGTIQIIRENNDFSISPVFKGKLSHCNKKLLKIFKDFVLTVADFNREIAEKTKTEGISHFLSSCSCETCRKYGTKKLIGIISPHKKDRNYFTIKKVKIVNISYLNISKPAIKLFLSLNDGSDLIEVVLDKELTIYSFLYVKKSFYIEKMVGDIIHISEIEASTVKFDTESKTRKINLNIDVGNTSTIIGSLEFPKEKSQKYPVALILPDVGPYNRDGKSMLGSDIKWIPRLKEFLIKNGVAVASFDKRGVGDSSYVLNLSIKERFKDIKKIYEYLRKIPTIDENSIILIGIGTGSLGVSSLALEDDIKPWCLIYIKPPLPNFREYIKNGEKDLKTALSILDSVETKKNKELKPFFKKTNSGRLIWMSSNPLETKDLLQTDFKKLIFNTKIPYLLILDKINGKKYSDNNNVFIDEKNDPEDFLRAILKFLEQQSK